MPVMTRISVHDLQHYVDSAASIYGVRSGLQATTQRTTSEITRNVISLARLFRSFNCAKAVEDYGKRFWTNSLFFQSTEGLTSIQVAILIYVRRVTAEYRVIYKTFLVKVNNCIIS